MNRQGQSAEDGAIQAQAGRDAHITVHQGLTPEVVDDLMEAAIAKASQQYALIAREEALVNARSFANTLVRELVGIGRLDVLADPAFLHLLDKANIKAATTKEPTAHEMLANLLAERAQREDKLSWAAVDRAVDIVPLLDARALTGLTVIDAALQWAARAPAIDRGLESLERVFEQVMVGELPEGADWLDHLDFQGCIRVNVANRDGFIPYLDWFAQCHSGYVCRGFDSSEEDAYSRKFALPPFQQWPMFTEHELLPGRFRPLWANHERAAEMLTAFGAPEMVANHVQAVALQDAALTNADEDAKSALGELLGSYAHLSRLQKFWDEIPQSFSLTRVGHTLARANARQLDKAGAIPVEDDE